MVQPDRADYDIFISFRGQGPPPESALRRVHASFIASAEHLRTAPGVHYPLCHGFPSSYRDGPHILSHLSFICSLTSHTCRDDDPHRGCRSTDPGQPYAAIEPLGPPSCLSACPCPGLRYPSPGRISSSTISPYSFLEFVSNCSSISYFTSSTSGLPRLRMILLQPLIEEVPLPPLTFSFRCRDS